MFFMMGVTPGRKDFDFNQTIICPDCGRYGRYNVFMTYMVLSLFFIPVFKWSKRYFVQSSCCNRIYELSPERGRQIARGEDVEIEPEDFLDTEADFGGYRVYKRCDNCGFETEEEFDFCPKCGRRI